MHNLGRVIGRLVAIIVTCLAAGTASADGTSLTWSGAGGAAWSGTEQNWLDGETPSAWIDGANATFGGAAYVSLGGTAAVSNLTTRSALTIDGPVSSTAFLNTSTPTLVFPGCTLDDIDGNFLGADITGASLGSAFQPAKAYHYKRSGATATAQFQAIYNGHLRCVKVTFSESSEGVMAQVGNQSFYVHLNDSGSLKIGEDIDSDPKKQTWGIVTTQNGSGGIGICNLRGAGPRVRVAGSVQLGGAVALTNAVMEVTKPVSHTLSQAMSGLNGGLVVKGYSDAEKDKTFGITSSSVGGSAASWLTSTAGGTVFTNMLLSRTSVESAVLRGQYIGSDTPATPRFVTYDGERICCQLQAEGETYVRGVVIELKQVGANVHARWIGGYYLKGGHLGDDITNGEYYARDLYGVKSLTLRTVEVPSLALDGNNAIANLAADNALMVFTRNEVRPKNNFIARNGALVLITGGGGNNSSGTGKTYTFESGSVFVPLVVQGTEGNAKYIFDNATLYTPMFHDSWKDGQNMFRSVTLRNGARTIGNPLRCGDCSTLLIFSDGAGTNVFGSGVCLYSQGSPTLYIVTSADLKIPGNLYQAPNYPSNTPIVKRGDATLTLSGTNSFGGAFTVEAGTVVLAGDAALPPNAPITLNGGTMACAAGVTTTTGVLTLSGDATINLGDGALAFADSSGATWAADATLTVTGTEPLPTRALRFGTSRDGLSYSQVRKITYNGERVSLNANGYLGVHGGINVIFR